MKKLLIILILFMIFISLNGCKKDTNKIDTENVTKSNEIENNVNKVSSDDKILSKIGISTQNDKIIIEPKKTKEFFNNLAKTMEKEAKKLKDKTKNINENDIGIHTNSDKITIDTNKTKTFLNNFAKELENVANNIEKSIEK